MVITDLNAILKHNGEDYKTLDKIIFIGTVGRTSATLLIESHGNGQHWAYALNTEPSSSPQRFPQGSLPNQASMCAPSIVTNEGFLYKVPVPGGEPLKFNTSWSLGAIIKDRSAIDSLVLRFPNSPSTEYSYLGKIDSEAILKYVTMKPIKTMGATPNYLTYL